MTFQDLGNGVYRVGSPKRSAITGRYVMNQREYESALKDLLEEVATLAEFNYSKTLDGLYMPQNVPGVDKISVTEWLDARFDKRAGKA